MAENSSSKTYHIKVNEMKTIHTIKRFSGFNIPYSVILRDAKTRLARTHYFDFEYNNEYVCHSIKANSKQKKFLHEWINELLDGACSFKYWLQLHHKLDYYSINKQQTMSYDEYIDKVQETRHAWLDWMIQYWENEEFKERIRGIK